MTIYAVEKTYYACGLHKEIKGYFSKKTKAVHALLKITNYQGGFHISYEEKRWNKKNQRMEYILCTPYYNPEKKDMNDWRYSGITKLEMYRRLLKGTNAGCYNYETGGYKILEIEVD